MANRRCKFATIYCAKSLEIPFLPRAHRRDLEAIEHIIVDKK